MSTYQGQSWVVRVHLQWLMHRVHHNVQTPHQCSGSSSNLDSQHNGSIPHVAAQVERFGNTHIQVEAKGAEVDEGDHAAVQAPFPASLELAGRYSSCIKDNALSDLCRPRCII